MKDLLTVSGNRFYLNGKPFFMCAGDLHYFRVHPSQWKERLRLMKDFGLTAVQTYCPWNLHEPRRGDYRFDGLLDLGRFIDEVAEAGLKLLLRPSPYMCSEWDLGGMPSWLLRDRRTVLRSCDSAFMEPVAAYLAALCRVFVPRLSTRGGPIIAVAVENEFGSYAYDPVYMAKNVELLRENGVDVPLYVTDGASRSMLMAGDAPDAVFHGCNLRAKPGHPTWAKRQYEALYGGEPYFITEFWAGRSIHWGEPFRHRDPRETSEAFREALELGGYVDFYMFSGGTNFGPMSGANYGRSYSPRPDTPVRYIPHTTSYDEDALISEYGTPTKKYFLCRDVLDAFLGKPKREWEPYEHKAQSIPAVRLTQVARLFDNLDTLTETEVDAAGLLCMEELGQDYGFLLYSTRTPELGVDAEMSLTVDGLRDRATVYLDGVYQGTRMRDRDESPLPLRVPAAGAELSLLVENVARINFGQEMQTENKGILRYVRLEQLRLHNWKHRTIPLSDITGLRYTAVSGAIEDGQPVFLRGTFDAKAGVDTFVCTRGFTRGHVWINGFDLGRYWNIGPQYTLYVPGALLKETDNVIEVFDVSPRSAPTAIDCIDRHLLEMDQ